MSDTIDLNDPGGRAAIGYLVAARERKGLSQKALGALMGVSQSKVSKMESAPDGDLRPTELVKYARALGLDVTFVMRPAPKSGSTPLPQRTDR